VGNFFLDREDGTHIDIEYAKRSHFAAQVLTHGVTVIEYDDFGGGLQQRTPAAGGVSAGMPGHWDNVGR
jgi:hypothetical protein